MSGLQSLTEWAAKRRRSRKAAGAITTGNFSTSSVVNGVRFRQLLDDTVATSQWLRGGVHMLAVDPGVTKIPVNNWENVRWQHRPDDTEGDGGFDATVRPASREVDINAQHYVMEMSLGKRAKRRAAALIPGTDLQRSGEIGFARAFGNNLARTVVRGDTGSADTSLKGITGLWLRSQQEARSYSFAQSVGGVMVAQQFDPDQAFLAAYELLPEGLRSERLRWYANDRLWTQYGRWVGNSGTSERFRDEEARRAYFDAQARTPLGRSGLSVPDWPADEGPSANAGGITDNGDGTLTARVNGVLPDANSYAGRRVRLTKKSSGVSEDLTVQRVNGQNVVTTTGSLSQAAISVVAADYTTKVIDETSLLLADPFGILLAMENQVEVYRSFNVKALTADTVAHALIDVRLLRSDAIARTDGIYLPRRA